MSNILNIEVMGSGSRKVLSDALRQIADNLWSENGIQEIYNIDGCAYQDCSVEVRLTDPQEETKGYQTTDKSEGGTL